MRFNTKIKDFRYVDLSPMVSIIFLLIIFFLVAGTIRSPSFWQIDLPISNSKDYVNPKMLSVYLNKDGKFAYEKQGITVEELKNILKEKSSDAILQIYADHLVDSLQLIRLLDILKSTIVNKVVLVTRIP